MNIEAAYNEAIKFAKNHYENFPVISYLIPKDLRKHIAIIYWFARTADDIADEGELNATDRLRKLDEFKYHLDELLKKKYSNHFEFALYSTIYELKLSTINFYRLLKAFRQDITKTRYKNFDELLEYCENSANPVGRLILEIFNIRIEEANRCSDSICTALQLTNFWQDTRIDFIKGRIYYPAEDMEKLNISEKMFELNENNFKLRQLVKQNVERTADLYINGKNLFKYLRGRLKYEISWTISGGEIILEKIRKNNYDVLNYRPSIMKKDFWNILVKTFTNIK